MMRRSHLCCHYLLSFLSFLITKIIVSSTTPVEEWVTVVLQMFDIVVDCDCWEAAEKINWQKMSQMFAKIWIELQKYLVRILQHLHSVRSEERDQHAVLQTMYYTEDGKKLSDKFSQQEKWHFLLPPPASPCLCHFIFIIAWDTTQWYQHILNYFTHSISPCHSWLSSWLIFLDVTIIHWFWQSIFKNYFTNFAGLYHLFKL